MGGIYLTLERECKDCGRKLLLVDYIQTEAEKRTSEFWGCDVCKTIIVENVE